MKRLAKLTSVSKSNLQPRINILYLKHAKALRIANLAPTIFPTMKEILDEAECEVRK